LKKVLARPFNTWRRSKFMTDDEISSKHYDAILALQGGRCAICETKSRKKFFVDRCRSKDRVRALLCRKCLTLLECFNYDPNLMWAAAKYRYGPRLGEYVRAFHKKLVERGRPVAAQKKQRPFLVWPAHLEGLRGDEQ
jgi:hypothetical protein